MAIKTLKNNDMVVMKNAHILSKITRQIWFQ